MILFFFSLFPFPFPVLLCSLESLIFNSFTSLSSLNLSPPKLTQRILSHYACYYISYYPLKGTLFYPTLMLTDLVKWFLQMYIKQTSLLVVQSLASFEQGFDMNWRHEAKGNVG